MNPNSNSGHRTSIPNYSPCQYSTPQYGGGTDRSASTSQAQYQIIPSQPQYSPLNGQAETTNQFQYYPSDDWPSEIDLRQQPIRPRFDLGNEVNAGELNQLSRSANEEPWTGEVVSHGTNLRENPQAFPPPAYGPRAHTVAEGMQRPQLMTSRVSFPPSQESGYESGRFAPGQDFTQSSMNMYEFQAGPRPAYGSDRRQPGPKSVRSEPATRRKSRAPLSPCPEPDCGKELKNKSDAEKHRQQHLKPFLCDVPGCTRQQVGFATENDRQRHRKSVHGLDPLVGKKTGYTCKACTQSASVTPKWWPRLDNFKAHIRRKHTDRDENELIKESESARPIDAMSESGYASQLAPSTSAEDAYQHDFPAANFGDPVSGHGLEQGETGLFDLPQGHFDSLATGIGMGPLADHFGGNRDVGPGLHGPRYEDPKNGLYALYDAAVQQTSPVDSFMASPEAHGYNVTTGSTYQNGFNGTLPAFPQTSHARHSAKRRRVTETSAGPSPLETEEDLSIHRTEHGDFLCPHCGKSKKRECDLRKHMKRHKRPYGCTFPNCYKTSGSRADWKRHENSQHFLQEMWRCAICQRLAYSEEKFINHLQRRHGQELESANIHDVCKSMHLGREGHHRYWCGFCNRLVEQNDGTQQDDIQQSAWALRFQHIGDHFDKKKCHIDQWICIEHNKPKALIPKEERKKGKDRLKNLKAGDCSDLGEDGITSPYVSRYPTSVCQNRAGSSSFSSNASGGSPCNKRKITEIDVDADRVSDSEY